MHSSSSAPEGESRVLACKGSISQAVPLTVGVVSAILFFILGGVLIAFIYLTRNEDVTYAIKVRKLLSAYRSFIQQIEGEFDTEGYQVVMVKTFTEMLGIRDTIQSPVLMCENEDETKAQFLIPTNAKLLYVFEIKVDNYDQIYGIRREEAPVEEAPVEEAHGAILSFEDEQGVEEAIIIEENVDMEELTQVMATPDVVLNEVDFVADNDVDYEGTEEEPGIEVVGVVWPEKTKNNKVYRYDPNGESLTEGDMVLVPTRDAGKERDVIRKAAVAHGNHMVDPKDHPHTIKKIIGVIKRHVETVLVSTAAGSAKAGHNSENQ
jgi:hypothetical protein